MRVGIVSDTHGFLDPRIGELVTGCDLAVHAGDIGSAQILYELKPRGGKVIAVRGNNDTAQKWPEGDGAVLDALADDVSIELPGGRLVVVHGHRAGPLKRRHERLRNRYAGARAIVYGHSHRLVCDQNCRPWVLNPGAAGRGRTFGGPSCLVLHARAANWKVKVVRFPV